MGVIESRNPATGEVIGTVEALDAQGAAAALERARRAAADWAARPYRERAEVVARFKDLLLDEAERVCELLSRENGKVLQESAVMEVFPIADLAAWMAREGERILQPKPIPLHLVRYRQSTLVHRPRGVVLVISPWNFPFTIPFGTVLPALLAGNAVLLKPASLTPLIALEGRRLLLEAGLPEDVFQVVPCSGRVASEIIDMGVDYVNFTGSTAVGREVAARCGRALVPCSMELGGKDPAIVLEDAPVEHTIRTLVWGAFANAGQVCASIERVYVVRSLYDRIVEGVVERTRALSVGDPLEDGTDMGPMTDPGQLAIVEEHVEDARARGARVLAGGRRPDRPGQFYEPTVLVDVTEDMRALAEETFGPTLPILPVEDEEEAVRRANDSLFGLDAYVFTRDLDRGRRVAERLRAGTVMVNEALITHAMPETPWGGVKESGLGRVHGEEGLLSLVETTHINEPVPGLPVRWNPAWQPYSHAGYRRLLGAARLLLRRGAGRRLSGLGALLRGR